MQLVGEITLNLSFVLYLFFYFPQLIHNIRFKKYTELSLGFHAFLFIAATADLYYGFGRIDQWQYRVVSMVMFSCLLIQHFQLLTVADQFDQGFLKLHSLSVFIVLLLVGLCYTLCDEPRNSPFFLVMGWVERVCYWCYVIPQLIKNHHSQAAESLSPVFIALGIVTGSCDVIAAWVFHWGGPGLYGTPVAIGLHIGLLWQYFRAKSIKIAYI